MGFQSGGSQTLHDSLLNFILSIFFSLNYPFSGKMSLRLILGLLHPERMACDVTGISVITELVKQSLSCPTEMPSLVLK